MDIRFRPEPPDAVKGVTPVKDQGADREKLKKRKADSEEKEDSNNTRDGENKGDVKRPVKDDTGHIVDVVI